MFLIDFDYDVEISKLNYLSKRNLFVQIVCEIVQKIGKCHLKGGCDLNYGLSCENVM